MNFNQLMDGVALSERSASLSVPQAWAQGRTIYGGLQAALAIKAMEEVVDANSRPLRSFQANFIGPVSPGLVVAKADLIRQGKSSSQVTAQIVDDKQPCFTAAAVFASGRQSSLQHVSTTPTPKYTIEDCEEVTIEYSNYSPFNPHYINRWPRGIRPYSSANKNFINAYVQHRDVSVTSTAHLLALADALPPLAVTQLKEFAPLSTMTWQLELTDEAVNLRDEAEAWFRFDITINASAKGYCAQSTHIWSPVGKLVAVTLQCIAVFG